MSHKNKNINPEIKKSKKYLALFSIKPAFVIKYYFGNFLFKSSKD